MPITARTNRAAMARFLSAPDAYPFRWMVGRMRLVENQAKRLAPARTGRLRASIAGRVWSEPGLIRARIGTPVKYASWVHDGTGLYGPARRRIYPRRARALHWDDVFAASTRGQQPRPFLRRALDVLGPGWRITDV